MNPLLGWLCIGLVAASSSAQVTWIVDAGGGPGAQFTNLPAAVAAASHGDTILVRQPLMGEAVTGFTTGKGLTIVGEGGGVPIYTGNVPIEVLGLPVGQRFRMVGFSQITDGELRVRVENCLGEVHLENLHAREPDFFGPQDASIRVHDAAFVSMRDIETFGLPAAWITDSTVVATQCRFGLTSIGLGGGPCLTVGQAAVVDVVEPRFDSGGLAVAIAVGGGSTLRIGGGGTCYVRASGFFGAGHAVVSASASTIVVDPAVTLLAGTGQPVFLLSGGATATSQSLPGNWCDRAAPLQTTTFESSGPVGSFVIPVLGWPLPPVSTPFGVLHFDPAAGMLVLGGAVVPAAGTITTTLLLPLGVPRGATFVTQSAVLSGPGLQLGTGVVFTVH